MATMNASHERIGVLMEVNQEATVAYPEMLKGKEPSSEEIKFEVMHEEVPKEGAAVKSFGTLGSASSCTAPRKAEGTDPEQWWVPEEIGSRPEKDYLPCGSCMAQGRQSSGMRHEHRWKRSF
jgi:hypothetical protein